VSYEFRIGWRYLYSGSFSRRALIGVLTSLAVTGLGLYLLVSFGGGSGVGALAFSVGMIAFVVFGLLSLFSVFTTVSVLGVVLGVAALTVVLAVTTGFQQQFREKVLGVNAHVIIMKNSNDFTATGPNGYLAVEKMAKSIDPDVIAVQPFIFVEMLVTRGKGELSGVAVKGVDPKRVTKVLDLEKHMLNGAKVSSLAEEPVDGPAPIIIGRELAHKLKAKVGDIVTVVAPLSNVDLETWTSSGDAPTTRKFRISGIFYSGFDEYDRRLMYVSLHEAQELWGQGDQVLGVELKVKDVDRAKEIADKIARKLGDANFTVQDWRELNKNLFTALTLQKIALLIILTLIIVVATFNMVSALTMMVIDKTREIAILRSMGSTAVSIARMFQVVGVIIGGVGTALGLGIGLSLCHVASNYGYHLDPKVYLIDRLPIAVNPFEVLLVAVITMVISAVATLFPSAKASAMRPVEGLRYD